MKKMARIREDGAGISARKMADGKCVNTIVLTRPILLEMAAAQMLERVEKNLPIASTVPSFPWDKWNFRSMKKAMSEKGTMPLASESTANRQQSRSMMLQLSLEICEIEDFFGDGGGAGAVVRPSC